VIDARTKCGEGVTNKVVVNLRSNRMRRRTLRITRKVSHIDGVTRGT